MKFINLYSKFIPYLYFITVVVYWFTDVNRKEGISAYPILLFGFPFLWQIIRPNKKLNFALGTIFVCLSSYIIIAYISNALNFVTFNAFEKLVMYGGLFVISNFIMAVWIIRNSLKRSS